MDLNETELDGVLLIKYINDTVSRQEREQVDRWLSEDPANHSTLQQLALLYHAQRTQQRIHQRNPLHALRKVQQRIRQRSLFVILRQVGVAASLLIGIMGIASFLLQKPDSVPQMITVTTNAGMRSQVTLPDSTVVHLNAGSTLVYPSKYSRKERRVQLSGEAFFQVAHNANQPFVVSAADDKVNIRVLGTQFNLQAYEKDSLVKTTLIDGSVQMTVAGKKEKIVLTPSVQATFDLKTGTVSRKKINTAPVTGWMDGRLIFKDTKMTDVLTRISHFYSVNFDVSDETIRNYTFTGTFENRPLFQILEYMKISSKIDYTMVYPQHQDVRNPLIQLKSAMDKKGKRVKPSINP